MLSGYKTLKNLERLIYAFLLILFAININLWLHLSQFREANDNNNNDKSAASHSRWNQLSKDQYRNVLKQRLLPRPSLESLVQGYNVTGNVSGLLDFAIVGFPKCGTSTMLHHLRQHEEIQMLDSEACFNSYDRPFDLTRQLYTNLTPDTNLQTFQRGLKCPIDLDSAPISLPNYNRYWPSTKFIVGLRHPVLWLESFYNFRIQEGYQMPPPNDLIGACRRGMHNVCTYRATFHLALGNLGKTNMYTSQAERDLILFPKFRRGIQPPPEDYPLARKRNVFLYELTQLQQSYEHHDVFLQDLQQFLGLQTPLQPMGWIRPQKNTTRQRRLWKHREARKINICNVVHAKVHDHLMQQAASASQWICTYFLKSPDVTTSGNFVALLQAWNEDPCQARRQEQAS